MDIFWMAAREAPPDDPRSFSRKVYELTSTNYRNVFEDTLEWSRGKGTNALPKTYCQIQLVTDYICGMTDTFACSLHKELTNG
jgi:dGTPase